LIDENAQQVLDMLVNYDEFMSQLDVIADMGSGAGHHSKWWATREVVEGNKNRKYTVLAIDDKVALDNKNRLPNIRQIRKDWDATGVQKNKVDLIWCYNSFQQSIDPFNTLRHWHSIMQENGMLILAIPQNNYIDDLSRWQVELKPDCYYSYNMVTLIRMLATSGFDCREGFLRQRRHDPYIWAAVYKSKHEPMDRRSTTWYDLMEKKLLPVSADNCVLKYGYLKQEFLVLEWLDRQRHDLAVEMLP